MRRSGSGTRGRSISMGIAVMAAAVIFGPSFASASPKSLQGWFHEYGGNLNGIAVDTDAVHSSAAKNGGPTVAICHTLTLDSSTMEGLPNIPNKSLEAKFKKGLGLLVTFGIYCQGGQGSAHVSDFNTSIPILDSVVKSLEKNGPALDSFKAKHAVLPTTPTTVPVNHVGDTLSTTSISVQLQQVIDPAQSDNQYLTPDPGKRFVGVMVQIENPGTTNIQDDANSDFTVIGSDGQIYTADFDTISGCTNFNEGEYGLTPTASVVGCVTFQIPTGVAVTKVDFEGSQSRCGVERSVTLILRLCPRLYPPALAACYSASLQPGATVGTETAFHFRDSDRVAMPFPPSPNRKTDEP